MFLSRNKKVNVYPCKPQFYCIKVGFKGVKIIYACFPDGESGDYGKCPKILNTKVSGKMACANSAVWGQNAPE